MRMEKVKQTYLDLPFVCKICAEIHQKNLPKGRNFTYLEDPGILPKWIVSKKIGGKPPRKSSPF